MCLVGFTEGPEDTLRSFYLCHQRLADNVFKHFGIHLFILDSQGSKERVGKYSIPFYRSRD